MHRILLINHYAGSPQHGMEHRTFNFAREWVKLGHKVLIVAASYSHLRQQNPRLKGLLARETIEGVDYLWVRTPRYQGNGVARLINMLLFAVLLPSACRRAIAALRPDTVIASSTYTWDNWPAANYARKYGARYVYELHDIWPLTLIELAGMSPSNPFIWSLQKAENFACRSADRVISLLPAAQPHLIDHGMPPTHFAYVPNGVVEEEWLARAPAPVEHVAAIREFQRDKRCLVGYVGGHNELDPLEPLIYAGADPALDGIGIVLIGNGSKKVHLEELAREKNSRTLFLPAVPKVCVPELLGVFDILYLGFPRSPLYRFGVSPNKLFEYMMAGVPILSAVEAANDPVRDSGCGFSIPPDDGNALCQGLRDLAALPPDEKRAMGERGRQYVKQHHLICNLAKQFLLFIWSADEHASKKHINK